MIERRDCVERAEYKRAAVNQKDARAEAHDSMAGAGCRPLFTGGRRAPSLEPSLQGLTDLLEISNTTEYRSSYGDEFAVQ
jgi:hypothetical protein